MATPVRLFRATGADRHAVVSAEPGTQAGSFLVRVARGASADALTAGAVYGPYAEGEVGQAIALAVANLEAEGFAMRAPGWSLVEALGSESPKARARAAQRIGWRRHAPAADALLAAAEAAVEAGRGEACTLVEALGRLGDARAVPLARELAARKNLSRRRSGVETLRLLEDADGLAETRARGLARLPEAVATHAEADVDVSALVAATLADDERRWGRVADVLYALGTQRSVAAARRVLAKMELSAPHGWRYAKSVLRRAMLRRDARTFGFLAYAIERAAVGHGGTVATVRSGRDGKKRSLRIFGPRTSAYVRRATWRYLRDLARWAPEHYPEAAAEVLVRYGEDDAQPPKGLVGRFGHAHLLQRIVHGSSPRLRVNGRTLRVAFTSAAAIEAPAGRWETVREEAFPEVWDAHPTALLRLLARAKLPLVRAFAAAGLARHPALLEGARERDLLRMLDAPPEGSPRLASQVVDELVRRHAPGTPPARLVVAVLESRAARTPPVLAHGRAWLEATRRDWLADPALTLRLVGVAPAAFRDAAIALANDALAAAPDQRAKLLTPVLARLRDPDASPASLAGAAALARGALRADLAAQTSTVALLGWLGAGPSALQRVAGELLALRQDAMEVLGEERVIALASHEIAAARRAARTLLAASRDLLAEPGVLFQLVESPWDDTRDFAARRLQEVPLETLGRDGLVGLCDSSDAGVEALGRELVRRHMETLDAEAMLFRLSEHPSRAMQAFVLELLEAHLREGYVPLSRLEAYFRAVLFDVWPSRPLKWGVLALLEARGFADERQAAFATGLLSAVLRTRTRGDFDRIAGALARLQVAFPALRSELVMTAPDGGAPA